MSALVSGVTVRRKPSTSRLDTRPGRVPGVGRWHPCSSAEVSGRAPGGYTRPIPSRGHRYRSRQDNVCGGTARADAPFGSRTRLLARRCGFAAGHRLHRRSRRRDRLRQPALDGADGPRCVRAGRRRLAQPRSSGRPAGRRRRDGPRRRQRTAVDVRVPLPAAGRNLRVDHEPRRPRPRRRRPRSALVRCGGRHRRSPPRGGRATGEPRRTRRLRTPLPRACRGDSGDVLHGRRQRLDRLVQPALVRVHRSVAGRGARLGLAGGAPS